SVREIWPSLFLSTVVKLGMEPLAPPAAPLPDGIPLEPPEELLPPLDMPPEEPPLEPPEEPPLEPPDALGVELEPLEDDPELCAMATLPSAKSAAVVAAVINFTIMCQSSLQVGWRLPAPPCNPH